MKKVILSFVVLGAIGFTSCNKDDGMDLFQQQLAMEAICDNLWNDYYEKGSAYSSDNSTANCEAYKNATTALKNSGTSCADGSETYLQSIIDDLNCAN